MSNSMAPQLRVFSSEQECKDYFITKLCRQNIYTHDGYKVYIRPSHFKHAFYEDDGKTAQGRFSFHRAKHIDWIQPTLEHPVKCHQGWDYKKVQPAPWKRVAYCYHTFVVIVEFRRNRDTKEIGAEFITCYDADRSFSKISHQPTWDPNVLNTL